MATKKATTILDYQVNQASVQAAVAANAKVATASNQLAETAKRGAAFFANEASAAKALGLSLEQLGVKAADVQLDKSAGVTKQLDTEKQITAEMQKQIDLNDKAIRGSSSSGIGGLKTGFGTLRAAGAAVSNIGGGREVTQAASLLGLASLGPAALAVGALGVGLKVVSDRADEAAKAFAATAAALASAKEATLTKTREELEIERKAAEALIEVRRESFADATQAFAKQEAVTPWLEQLLNTNVAFQEAELAMNQAGEALTVVENDLYALEDVLAVTGETAADAAAAIEALKKAQLDAADLALDIDRLTKVQRDERVKQDQRDIEILYERIQAGELDGQALVETAAQMKVLADDIVALESVSSTYADQLEREEALKQQLTDQTDKYFEALKQEEDIRDTMTEIRAKEAEIIGDRNEKVLELQADLADKFAMAQEGASEKLLEIEDATAEKRQEIAENSAEKLFKLQRDAGRDLFDATAERDALAHSKRTRQLSDDLADAQSADEKSSEQLQKQRDKQTEQVSDNLEKQRKIAEKAFDKATNDLYNTTVKQLNVQRRAYQEQEVALQNTLFNEQQIALYGSGSQRVIHTQMWTDLAGIAAIGVRNVVSAFGGAIGGVFGGGGSQFPTLSSTYPGGPSQTQVFNQQFDRRFNQTINASSNVRGPF